MNNRNGHKTLCEILYTILCSMVGLFSVSSTRCDTTEVANNSRIQWPCCLQLTMLSGNKVRTDIKVSTEEASLRHAW
jgi:hypothetical protein